MDLTVCGCNGCTSGNACEQRVFRAGVTPGVTPAGKQHCYVTIPEDWDGTSPIVTDDGQTIPVDQIPEGAGPGSQLGADFDADGNLLVVVCVPPKPDPIPETLCKTDPADPTAFSEVFTASDGLVVRETGGLVDGITGAPAPIYGFGNILPAPAGLVVGPRISLTVTNPTTKRLVALIAYQIAHHESNSRLGNYVDLALWATLNSGTFFKVRHTRTRGHNNLVDVRDDDLTYLQYVDFDPCETRTFECEVQLEQALTSSYVGNVRPAIHIIGVTEVGS